MNLDRLANASRVADELENHRIVFRQMHPLESTPVWYQIAGADIDDLTYAIHQAQRLLHILDMAIETLERLRGDAHRS